MKKKYEIPRIEVIEFTAEDVIVTSGEGEGFIDLTSNLNIMDIFDVIE